MGRQEVDHGFVCGHHDGGVRYLTNQLCAEAPVTNSGYVENSKRKLPTAFANLVLLYVIYVVTLIIASKTKIC